MKRRTVNIRLSDDKEYLFSERNVEDASLFALQERLRARKCRFINENIDDEAERLSLLMAEMSRVYQKAELDVFAESAEEKIAECFDSFKISNSGVDKKTFNDLMLGLRLDDILAVIDELEKQDAADVKKKGRR